MVCRSCMEEVSVLTPGPSKMAAPSRTISVLRSIIRELRMASPKGTNLRETIGYQHLMNQYRKYQVTDQKICKSQKEMKYLAESYLCYLQSSRRRTELHNEYHGKGERGIEETAKLVGLRLPRLYQDPKSS